MKIGGFGGAVTACVAMAVAQPVMAQDRCRLLGLGAKSTTPIVTLGPGGLAAVTVCIGKGSEPAIDILADDMPPMPRSYEGNCGTVSGRMLRVTNKGNYTLTISYCIEAVSLRPGN